MANLCIVGACGRMGRMVAEKAKACGFKLTGAVEVPGAPGVGENFYGVIVTDDLEQGLKGANVVIEFALPEGIEKRAELYAKHNVAAVIGTTAVGALGLAALDAAAQKIPIIHAPNFSLGVNLLGLFLEKAAGVLDASYDVEIVEMHHHFKKVFNNTGRTVNLLTIQKYLTFIHIQNIIANTISFITIKSTVI